MYKDVFKDNKEYIATHFPVSDSLSDLMQNGIIDDKCRRALVNAEAGTKGNVLMTYLLEQTIVDIYVKFIDLCESKKNILAKHLKRAIDDKLEKNGLPTKYNRNDHAKTSQAPISGKLALNTPLHTL